MHPALRPHSLRQRLIGFIAALALLLGAWAPVLAQAHRGLALGTGGPAYDLAEVCRAVAPAEAATPGTLPADQPVPGAHGLHHACCLAQVQALAIANPTAEPQLRQDLSAAQQAERPAITARRSAWPDARPRAPPAA